MLENKRKSVLIAVGLLIICFFVIGVSYAVWSLTFTQTDSNVVTTGCFKVEFTDQNPITLDKAYPMSDEEGKSLTPYEFTLTNTCDSEATYYINLETITSAAKKLSEEYLKVNLKKGENEVFSSTLNSSYINLDKVISESSNAYKLYQGELASNEVATFHLNLWLDENTSSTEDVMNATYEGKVTVSTSYRVPSEIENMMIPMDVKTWFESTIQTDVTLNNTYTQNNKYSLLNEIQFQSQIQPYENALEVVDFSLAQDRSVLGYYVDSGLTDNYDQKKYNLYIQANGKIKANYNASCYGMTQVYYGLEDDQKVVVNGLENLDTSMATNMSYMFAGCNNTSLNLSSFDTSKVTDMSYMFFYMKQLTNLDLTSFDTTNVTNTSYMFHDTYNLSSINLEHFDTSNVTDMSFMFSGMNSLTNLNLRNFDTKNVTNMSWMFGSTNNLTSLDISSFNTSNVTNMSYMFYRLENLASITYGENFIHKDNAEITDMYHDCPANKPTHESWNGVSF